MTCGEAGSRLHEAGVALGDRDRKAGADQGSLARTERDPFARSEVEARVAVVGLPRQDGILAQSRDREIDHRCDVAVVDVESATRYEAKRRTSRCGRRALIRTPSSVSRRSSIGAPSA